MKESEMSEKEKVMFEKVKALAKEYLTIDKQINEDSPLYRFLSNIIKDVVWAQECTREELIIRALSAQDEELAIKDMLDDPLCWGRKHLVG